MKWCCERFKNKYDDRYGRTIFVFSSPSVIDKPHADFWIGMRCIEQKEMGQDSLRGIRDDLEVTINTSSPIHYCPWCGKNLRKYYGDNPEHLFDNTIIYEFSIR